MPTPSAAAGIDERRIADHLKTHRIRHIAAAEVLAILRQKANAVSPRTSAAALAHVAALAERLKHFASNQY